MVHPAGLLFARTMGASVAADVRVHTTERCAWVPEEYGRGCVGLATTVAG